MVCLPYPWLNDTRFVMSLFKFGFTGSKKDSAESTDSSNKPKGRDATKKEYEKKIKRIFVPKWLEEYDWLVYNESQEVMFCQPCQKYAKLSGSSFVTGCSSFRLESIKTHESNSAHETANKRHVIETMKEKKQTVVCTYTGSVQGASLSLEAVPGCPNVVGALDLTIQKLNKDQQQALSVCFNSAYWVAKNELPFTLYPSILDLQEQNGVTLAKSYKSDQACRRFIPYIFDDLKKSTGDILDRARVLAIMFDGATDVSISENELVYARVLVDGAPRCLYIKIQPVQHAHAEGVLEAIDIAMSEMNQSWKEKLVATGSDGTSVNLGRHRSVTALLKRDIPWLLPIHCVNHRLELGVLDAIKDRAAAVFSDLKSMLLHLHKHYHYSAKALRELRSLAEAMEVKMLRPANLKGTRWMPHLSRSLKVLLKPESYKVFITHFEDIVQGGKGSADVQGRAKNVLRHLKSEKLLHYMHFLQDVMDVLSDLSLQFQRDTCSIPDVLDSTETACLRLIALQQRPGKHLQRFLDGVTHADGETLFQEAHLSACDLTRDQLTAKKNSLIDAVIDHISNRLKDIDTSPILKAMQVFFMRNLPETEAELAVYGEEEIDILCNHFEPILTRLES